MAGIMIPGGSSVNSTVTWFVKPAVPQVLAGTDVLVTTSNLATLCCQCSGQEFADFGGLYFKTSPNSVELKWCGTSREREQ